MQNELTIITPVYNDWLSMEMLMNKISDHLKGQYSKIHLLAVNDSSTESFNKDIVIGENIKLTIIDLAINVGHQRAIIIGLCYISQASPTSECIIVMDSDGEDNPADITALIAMFEQEKKSKIIFAKRGKRNESFSFKIMYFFYKILFNSLTGIDMRYGNFSCVPVSLLPRITHNSDFWNHYPGAIIKSKMPYVSVLCQKAKRYFGKSKMNSNNLILHGLSSLSLYLDVIIVKFLKFSIVALIVVLSTIPVILYDKYIAKLAIPGWTSFLAAIAINMLLMILLFTFLVVLQLLNNRSQKPSHPINFYRQFILSVNDIN